MTNTNRCVSVIDRCSYHKLVTCCQTHTHCSPVCPAYSLMRMTQCMTSSGTWRHSSMTSRRCVTSSHGDWTARCNCTSCWTRPVWRHCSDNNFFNIRSFVLFARRKCIEFTNPECKTRAGQRLQWKHGDSQSHGCGVAVSCGRKLGTHEVLGWCLFAHRCSDARGRIIK